MAASTFYAHVTKRPGVCGGKATIDNTRIRVNNVVFLHKQGCTPDEIIEEYPDLSHAQVHAALVYYHDQRDEVDAELAAEDGWEERFEQAKAESLSRRSAQ